MNKNKIRTWKGFYILLCLTASPLLGLLAGGPGSPQQPVADVDTPSFTVDTDLVLLNVSVTDNKGRSVAGLTADDVEVFEDKVQQEVAFFARDEKPLAQGIVLDTSGSMSMDFKIDRAQAASLHFVQTSVPEDETFLMTFSSAPELAMDFTSDLGDVADAINQSRAGGKTALYDAVYRAVEKLSNYSTSRRKVILLISDGADTTSQHSLRDVRDLVSESDVQIFSVGIMGRDLTPQAMSAIEDFAEITGGLSFFPRDPRQMVNICLGIAADLRQEYVLGYKPTNPAKDGSWREVQLKINSQPGWPKLTARTRTGYYAK